MLLRGPLGLVEISTPLRNAGSVSHCAPQRVRSQGLTAEERTPCGRPLTGRAVLTCEQVAKALLLLLATDGHPLGRRRR